MHVENTEIPAVSPQRSFRASPEELIVRECHDALRSVIEELEAQVSLLHLELTAARLVQSVFPLAEDLESTFEQWASDLAIRKKDDASLIFRASMAIEVEVRWLESSHPQINYDETADLVMRAADALSGLAATEDFQIDLPNVYTQLESEHRRLVTQLYDLQNTQISWLPALEKIILPFAGLKRPLDNQDSIAKSTLYSSNNSRVNVTPAIYSSRAILRNPIDYHNG